MAIPLETVMLKILEVEDAEVARIEKLIDEVLASSSECRIDVPVKISACVDIVLHKRVCDKVQAIYLSERWLCYYEIFSDEFKEHNDEFKKYNVKFIFNIDMERFAGYEKSLEQSEA